MANKLNIKGLSLRQAKENDDAYRAGKPMPPDKSKVSIYAKKMKLDKPSKGNADKSPRTAKADY